MDLCDDPGHEHGKVGLRPLSRTAEMDHSHNHGGSWMGTPTYAEQQGILKHDDYKLIQMVEEPSFFAENESAQAVIQSMEGVAYECHQFNRHWPLETGWSRPDKVVKGAQWTLDQGLEYIFYYGPLVWKSERYYEFIERDWLETYWEAGLPKHHPGMHYYLNTFPHKDGRWRPVGPESDPHSTLGLTKWLIEEIKFSPPQKK